MRHLWATIVSAARQITIAGLVVLAVLLSYGQVRGAPSGQAATTGLFKLANPQNVPVNGDVTFAIVAINYLQEQRQLVVEDAMPPQLQILRVGTLQGFPCSTSGQNIRCVLDLAPGSGDTINVVARVRADTPQGSRITNTASAGGVTASALIYVENYTVTPRPVSPTPTPWPTVAPTYTAQPTWTALPTFPPTATPPGWQPSATPPGWQPTTTRTPWPTATATETPYAGVWLSKSVSLSTVALGQSFSWYIAVNSGDPNPRQVRIIDQVGWSEVELVGVSATQGSCSSNANGFIDCTVTVAQGSPARITINQRVRNDPSAAGKVMTNIATGTLRNGEEIRSNPAYVQVTNDATPVTSPTTRPPGSGPTATPNIGGPTETPPWNPTATRTVRPTSTPPGFVPTPTEQPPSGAEPLAIRPSTQQQVAPPLANPVEITWDVFIGSGVAPGSRLVLQANPQSAVQNGGLACGPTTASPSAPWTGALSCEVNPGQQIRVGIQLMPNTMWAAGNSYVWPLELRAPNDTTIVARASGSFILADQPTPQPTEDPMTSDAPCAVAARYALTKQGALYSQGGALAADPINPATGRPYSRTGPDSFDCSGLVFASYRAAGVTVGGSTYTQINDGTPIDCTLADLNGTSTTCWAPGDLIFLRYGGSTSGPGAGTGQHVAIYVGSGLFMDCYNHATGCILHDVENDSFYRRHFWQARRVVQGCEGMTIDPGDPVTEPIGPPQDDTVCVPEGPDFPDTGVNYMRGCGPPVLPDDGSGNVGTKLSQFDGIVAWLGETGRPPPAGSDAHLEYRIRFGGQQTDMCVWPQQLAGYTEGSPPPGGEVCSTIWADPMAFLPQANGDTMNLVDGTPVPVGWNDTPDPNYSDNVMQLPPPGHPSTLMFSPPDGDPGGAWWSPGNDERANDARCPLGGPKILNWFEWLINFLFGWLFGC